MNHCDYRFLLQAGKKVLVLGAGRSGIAASRLLLKHGMKVVLYDDKTIEHLRFFNAGDFCTSHALETHFGNTSSMSLDDVVAVVISPGINTNHDVISQTNKLLIPMLSEIDVAVLFLPPHSMIGITGTNGKSTTTVMIESILKAAGKKALACGNIGTPLCDVVMDQDGLDYLVIELSSFQLETIFLAKLDHAVIINITPDHLDRYHSFADYSEAKYRIASLLKPDATLVLNTSLKKPENNKNVLYFSSEQFGKDDFSFLSTTALLGEHNRENAMAAALIALSLKISAEHIVQGLKNFKSLPHRCEIVATKNDITFINDSKGTTVVAVKKALSMFNAPIHLLIGGVAKGEDFAELRTEHYPHIAGYYVYGQAATKIMRELNSPLSIKCNDLEQAFYRAQKNAPPGAIVLLSPACASYDQFNDYHHRGETFRTLVHRV